jgi:hypothetical protein
MGIVQGDGKRETRSFVGFANASGGWLWLFLVRRCLFVQPRLISSGGSHEGELCLRE